MVHKRACVGQLLGNVWEEVARVIFLVDFSIRTNQPPFAGIRKVYGQTETDLQPLTVTRPHCHNGGVSGSAGRGPRDKPLRVVL